MDELRLRALEECHYLKKIRAGDEGYYWCDLSDHLCGVEYNDEECEEYNDFVRELLANKIKQEYNKEEK